MRRGSCWAVLLAFLLAAPSSAGPTRGWLERLRKDASRWRREAATERALVLAQARGLLARRPPPPDFAPRRCGAGSLRWVRGVPVLTLVGTPEEMGRQHGTLLREELSALRAYLRAFVGPRRFEAAIREAERTFRGACSPDELAELDALSRASGVPPGELFLAQSFTDLYRAFACSTLAAESSEGPFLARNLDFPSMGFLQRFSLVVAARPRGRRAYVAVGWPGLVGVLSGQSGALALAVLVVHDGLPPRPGLPFQLAFRRVLERAESVSEAERLLRRLPLTVANNLALVDAAGEAVVLELSPEGVEARRPGEEGALLATNHFLTRARRRPRASLTYLSSRRRYAALRRVARARRGAWDLRSARRALDAAAVPLTVQSMVFLPRAGALEVAFCERGPATRRGRWVRLRLRELLGEPGGAGPR
ncbi:MAG: hypothetical protein D6731_21155 [Planctomycetota bacterium]|nr:MAG: hypothetical protein D6731_21155 [Planctomycetota bacterium]